MFFADGSEGESGSSTFGRGIRRQIRRRLGRSWQKFALSCSDSLIPEGEERRGWEHREDGGRRRDTELAAITAAVI